MSVLDSRRAAAQANAKSLLRTVLDRGHVLVGTGSTNAPWHFEDEAGKLVGMDIAMARILAKGLFDDESKVKFVLQDPGQRIPNIAAGKVDIVIQFMTMTPQRAQISLHLRYSVGPPQAGQGSRASTRPSGSGCEFTRALRLEVYASPFPADCGGAGRGPAGESYLGRSNQELTLKL